MPYLFNNPGIGQESAELVRSAESDGPRLWEFEDRDRSGAALDGVDNAALCRIRNQRNK